MDPAKSISFGLCQRG